MLTAQPHLIVRPQRLEGLQLLVREQLAVALQHDAGVSLQQLLQVGLARAV